MEVLRKKMLPSAWGRVLGKAFEKGMLWNWLWYKVGKGVKRRKIQEDVNTQICVV